MKLIKIGETFWNIENIISVKKVNNGVSEILTAAGRFNVPFPIEEVLNLINPSASKKSTKTAQVK